MFKGLTSYIIIFCALFSGLLIMACANRGMGPQGGPKDITPPKLVSATPADRSVNQDSVKFKAEFLFNEIILLENQSENIIISPPQENTPEIKALSRKVVVNFKDTLRSNTTYTINFGSAVVDNNEKNKLENFTYAFSTGEVIDSLKIRGYVLDAQSLAPVDKIFVGVHRDLDDSAFTAKPFDFIAKTNEKGEFEIGNIPSGTYRLYALADIGAKFRFDMPTEKIAFLDSLIVPSCSYKVEMDTVWRDTLKCDTTIIPLEARIFNPSDSVRVQCDTIQLIDSISPKYIYTYTPDSLILRAFEQVQTRKYLAKSERPQKYMLQFAWGAPIDSLPKITPLNVEDSLWNVMPTLNENSDTLRLWLVDTTLVAMDTIRLEVVYPKTDGDSLYIQTDTISFANRVSKSKKSLTKEPQKEKLFSTNIVSAHDLNKNIYINMAMPSRRVDSLKCVIQQKKDTTWIDLPTPLRQLDSIGMRYCFEYKWDESMNYRLWVDSAAFVTITGAVNEADSATFTTKSMNDYAKLILNLSNYTGNEVVELLDSKESVFATATVEKMPIVIEYIPAGVYYLRAYVDENQNGKWDTGLYKEHRQPEQMIYFPYQLEMRAFWDVEEDWNLLEDHPLEQRPDELDNKGNNSKEGHKK